jgi:hypothetical protein
MSIALHFSSMPVDRKLAIESLKRLDQKLYSMYQRMKDLEDYVRNDVETFQKLHVYLLSLDAVDHLEKLGVVEIINDYENKAVLLRRNYS